MTAKDQQNTDTWGYAGQPRRQPPDEMKTPGYAALRKGRYSTPGVVYHVVTTSYRRQAFFQDFWTARAVIPSLYSSQSAETLAFALMPDHLHWLIRLGDKKLAVELHAMKSMSAKRVNRQLGRTGPVWTPGYYERALRYEEDLRDAARYVVANPLRAGLAKHLAEYSHWDAAWLTEGAPPVPH